MTNTTQRIFYAVFALLFVFGMHYFQHYPGGDGLEVPTNLMTWCFVSVLIGLSLWNSSSDNTLIYSRLLISASLFTAALFIPILFGNNELLYHSIQRFIGLIAGLIFLFSLHQINLSSKTLNKLIFWILIGVILEGLFGLTQKYLLTEGNWIGFDITMRPFGIFRQPNVASTFFVMGIALSAFLLSFMKNISKHQQALIYFSSLLAGWLIILNSSKTATISLFIVLIGTAPLLYKCVNKTIVRRWYLFILIGLLIPFLLNIFNDGFTPREIIANVRPTLYLISLIIISQNLLTGTGYGSFSHHFHQAQASYIETNTFNAVQFANNANHPHNEILLWGVEGGVLPIAAMTIIAVYTCYRYFSLGWKKGLFLMAVLFPSLFHSMTELPFYHTTIVWITFIFTLYIIEKTAFNESAIILPKYINFKISALLIPLITVPFMLSGLHTLNRLNKFVESKYTQFGYLQEIINPVSIANSVEYSWFLSPLLNNKNDSESVHYFIETTEKLVEYWPRAKLYKDLSRAYEMIDEHDLAFKNYKKGKRLFPYSSEFDQTDSKNQTGTPSANTTKEDD